MAVQETLPSAILPVSLLVPFHEITFIRWDEKTGTGRIEAVRRNRLDDWFYACHFLGDPVMPGCWGVDAVWQCLRYFAAWRGLPLCRPVGMDEVRFFGQIRPGDERIVYAVDVLSAEESDGEWLVTGRAEVSVDGVPVYSIGRAEVGTALWESAENAAPTEAGGEAPSAGPLSYDEFRARGSFSHSEIVAVSQGTLVREPPAEFGLLPSGLMLEIGRVSRITYDPAAGSGRVTAAKDNDPHAWYYPMNGGVKPAALSIDAVWQLMGLFLSWGGNLGTGRALGFERVELFGEVVPSDRRLLFELEVARLSRSEATGDASVRADAKVFADGRLILSCANATVGCHKGIRYSDYPHSGDMSRGGKVKARIPAPR